MFTNPTRSAPLIALVQFLALLIAGVVLFIVDQTAAGTLCIGAAVGSGVGAATTTGVVLRNGGANTLASPPAPPEP